MIKIRIASLALAVIAVVGFGSYAQAGCGGKPGLFAKLHAGKAAGCNGGGLFAKLKAKHAAKCSAPAPSCCEPAPSCGCEAPAPSCGCGTPAPSCGCGTPAPAPCGCGSAPVEYTSAAVATPGCSTCGTTVDSGSITTGSAVPPAPAPAAAPAPAPAPAAEPAPASVSDKAPSA